MGLFSNRVSALDLRPGDHIYSWRSAYLYAHHGIHVGDHKVIHFTRLQEQELVRGTGFSPFFLSISDSAIHHPSSSPCEECRASASGNGVLLSCLDCFLAGYPLYRFEYEENMAIFLAKARGGTCTLAPSDGPEVVLHRAHYLLDSGFGCYHTFKNNCEDFAAYCKTGLLIKHENSTMGSSGQATSSLGATVSALCSSMLKLAIPGPIGAVVAAAGIYCISRYYADLVNRMDLVKVPVEDLIDKFESTAISEMSGQLPYR